MEGVGVGPDHHHHLLERVGASTELSPVDPVLVAAPVVAPAVPDPVEVGVGAGVIPPAALLVVGAVACRRERARRSGRRFDLCPLFALGGLPRDPCPLGGIWNKDAREATGPQTCSDRPSDWGSVILGEQPNLGEPSNTPCKRRMRRCPAQGR